MPPNLVYNSKSGLGRRLPQRGYGVSNLIWADGKFYFRRCSYAVNYRKKG